MDYGNVMDGLEESASALYNITIYCPSLEYLVLGCFFVALHNNPSQDTVDQIAWFVAYAAFNGQRLEKIRLCVPHGISSSAPVLDPLGFPTTFDLTACKNMNERCDNVEQWTRAFPAYLQMFQPGMHQSALAKLKAQCEGAAWLEKKQPFAGSKSMVEHGGPLLI